MKKLLTLFFSVAFVFFSCSKEESLEDADTGGSLLVRTVISTNLDSVVTTYEYDDKKRLTMQIIAGSVFGTTVNAETRISRNAQGVVQQIISTGDQPAAGSVTYNVNFNSSNSRYTSKVATYTASGAQLKDSTAYTFDASGRVKQEERFINNGITGGYAEIEKTEYFYDGDGNVTKATTYEFNSTTRKYVAAFEVTYEYDNKINPLRLSSEAFLIGDVTAASKNNVTKTTLIDLRNPADTEIITTVYTYDSAGRPLTATSTYEGLGISITNTYYYQ